MSFLSPDFFLFIATLVVGFYLVYAITDDGRVLRWILLSASLLFYGFHKPPYLLLLLPVSLVAFLLAGVHTRRGLLSPLPGALLMLLPLFYFKYLRFLANQLSASFLASTLLKAVPPEIPLGISFFTFQNISYIVDVHRNLLPRSRSFRDYLLYISFFPQLVAGPIVHGRDFLPQLQRLRIPEVSIMREAIFFLVSGFLKKGVLADHLARVVDPLFANPAQASGGALWLGVFAYSMQIYFDFSGYSDIALGLGRLFGIELPDNFNYPYLSCSFQEFWRRWHITLSGWLRDHIYIPLGGSRHGNVRMYAAILVTMVLGGIWHGAHWNFLIWGALHGAILTVERILGGVMKKRVRMANEFSDLSHRIFSLVKWAITFLVVSLLWIPFRTGQEGSVTESFLILQRMLLFAPGFVSESDGKLVLSLFLFMMLSRWLVGYIEKATSRLSLPLLSLSWAFVALLIISFSPGGKPFIYFVF